MLQAWYRYADRVGRYEAGPQDATRVAVTVAVKNALLGFGLSWPFFFGKHGEFPFIWMGIALVVVVVAVIFGIMLIRFHPQGHKDATLSRTPALVFVAWVVACLLLRFSTAFILVPLWGVLALDALAHITKVLRSTRKDAATPVEP